MVHPENPGQYVLGIECDGATYHSARSARERDRQRQAVLEGHGWKIHRIWSTDWFTRPQEQLERAVRAIENAIACAEIDDEPEFEAASTIEIERLPAEPIESAGTPSGIPYVEADHSVDTTLDIHEVDAAWMMELVIYIVGIESPIRRSEIIARVRGAWGVGRAGKRIQDAVTKGIDGAVQAGMVLEEREVILFPEREIQIRDRSEVQSASLKKVGSLPPQEIQVGILQLVKASHGVETADLAVGVARMLGFKSTSKQLRELVVQEVAVLIERGELVEDGELLKCRE